VSEVHDADHAKDDGEPLRDDDIEEAQDKPVDYLGEHDSKHAMYLFR
jgi:hypothetical protein